MFYRQLIVSFNVSHDKGSSLQLVVADLFSKNGYTVVQNVKKKGRSGVEHEIDVYAEYNAPLHRSVIIIEAKSYQEKIDNDKVTNFIQIVDDLKADRGIFVTTSDFTASALATAEQYSNIELWNSDKLIKLIGQLQISSSDEGLVEKTKTKIKMVAPVISYQQIEPYMTEQIKKKAKGGLFGAGKVIERLQGIRLVLYPYYDLAIEARVIHAEKTGLFSKKEVEKIIPCKISLDAITGEIVDVTRSGLSYRYAYLSHLTEDEAKLLRVAPKGKLFDATVAMAMGYDESKAMEIMNGLVGKGIANASNTKPGYYKIAIEYPYDPSALNSISVVFPITDHTEESGMILEPKIESAMVSKAIENYWDVLEVDHIATIYYPFYEIWFEREDGSTRVEVLDALLGVLNERVATILAR